MPETKAPIQFRLEALQIKGFEEVTRRLPASDRSEGALTYVPRFGLGFDEASRRIDVGVLMDVFIEPDEADGEEADGDGAEASTAEHPAEEHRVARLEVSCQYRLESLEALRDEEGRVCVPRPFLAHLVGMSVSAVRGALVGRTHHPIFQRAPLPVGRPLDFIDELIDASGVDWVESKPAKPPSP